MNLSHNKKKCNKFKSTNGVLQESSYDRLPNCTNCAYFSSLNCGNDGNDFIASYIDFTC